MKRVAIGIALCVAASAAWAAMPPEKMALAHGLAEVINRAEQCGFEIDQEKLQRYYSSVGLDTPEAFGAMSLLAMSFEEGPPPSPSACTLAKTTGEKLGIVRP